MNTNLKTTILKFSIAIDITTIMAFLTLLSSLARAAPVERVIFIGVDGLGSYLGDGRVWQSSTDLPTTSVIENYMPNLNGYLLSPPIGMNTSWTLRLLNQRETSSGVNWAALFSAATPQSTAIGGPNTTGNTAAIYKKNRIANIFSVYHSQRFINKSTLASGINNTVGLDLATQGSAFDTVDLATYTGTGSSVLNDTHVTDTLLSAIDTDFGFLFGYYFQVDAHGHKYGWGSDEYNNAVTRVDTHIKEIMDKLVTSNKHSSTLVVITSDHGGGGLAGGDPDNPKYIATEHGHNTASEHLVPLVLIGPNDQIAIGELPAKSTELLNQDINANYRNIDVAPTIAALLNIDTPVEWQGQLISQVFQNTPSPTLTQALPFIEAAVASINDKQYLYTGELYERFKFSVTGHDATYPVMDNDYPRRISKNFPGVPNNIDASLYRKYNNRDKLYFFQGNQYYRFDVSNNSIDSSYPKNISAWKLTWNNVDAVFNNLSNNTSLAYFFNGTKVHTYNLSTYKAYPEDTICNVFQGFSCNKTIDAAIANKDSTDNNKLYAYLFSGNSYYLFAATDATGTSYNKVYGPNPITTDAGGNWEGMQLKRY